MVTNQVATLIFQKASEILEVGSDWLIWTMLLFPCSRFDIQRHNLKLLGPNSISVTGRPLTMCN